MQQNVRDRVTELIFRTRLSPNVQLRNVYNEQEARHDQATSAVGAGAAAATGGGAESQQADQEAAQRAGSGEPDRARNMSRRQRRAAEARERTAKTSKPGKQRKKRSR